MGARFHMCYHLAVFSSLPCNLASWPPQVFVTVNKAWRYVATNILILLGGNISIQIKPYFLRKRSNEGELHHQELTVKASCRN
jgi:membrane protein YdbS with pleckstrin-like domain